jgi:hypothetical protein
VLFGGALILTVIASAIVFHWFPGKHANAVQLVIGGYAGLILFGAAACKTGWMLLTARGPVLVISRYGIRDLRLSREFISWDFVLSVSPYEIRQRKFVMLRVTPAMEKLLVTSALRKIVRAMNSALGANGLVISPTGPAVAPDRLLDLCDRYYAAHKHAGSDRSGPTANSV